MRAATQWADAETFWRARRGRLALALARHAHREHCRALLAEHGGHRNARLLS